MAKKIAKEILGEVDLSKGAMHSVEPNIGRLTEKLEEGTVIRGYCSNCGSYPGYPEESAKSLAGVGKFTLPEKEEIQNYYISVNSCGVCKKQIEPIIELKKFS